MIAVPNKITARSSSVTLQPVVDLMTWLIRWLLIILIVASTFSDTSKLPNRPFPSSADSSKRIPSSHSSSKMPSSTFTRNELFSRQLSESSEDLSRKQSVTSSLSSGDRDIEKKVQIEFIKHRIMAALNQTTNGPRANFTCIQAASNDGNPLVSGIGNSQACAPGVVGNLPTPPSPSTKRHTYSYEATFDNQPSGQAGNKVPPLNIKLPFSSGDSSEIYYVAKVSDNVYEDDAPDVITFNLDKTLERPWNVSKANLMIYVRYRKKPENKNLKKFINLTVYRVTSSKREINNGETLASMRVPLRHTRWHKLLLPTSVIQEAVERPGSTLRLRLVCSGCNDSAEPTVVLRDRRQKKKKPVTAPSEKRRSKGKGRAQTSSNQKVRFQSSANQNGQLMATNQYRLKQKSNKKQPESGTAQWPLNFPDFVNSGDVTTKLARRRRVRGDTGTVGPTKTRNHRLPYLIIQMSPTNGVNKKRV